MKELGSQCGHSNRIFSVRFNVVDPNMIASGGWDNTVQIYDIRKKGPIESLFGPHICGETLDFKNDGFTLLTGSYRMDDVIELWDLRKFEKFRVINWNGPGSSQPLEHQLLEDRVYEDDYYNLEEEKNDGQQQLPLTNDKRAPFIYSAMFNNKYDTILAAGAGSNQVRLFDYETGEVTAVISEVPKPVLCMAKANHSLDFAFGSADSRIRLMDMKKSAVHQTDNSMI